MCWCLLLHMLIMSLAAEASTVYFFSSNSLKLLCEELCPWSPRLPQGLPWQPSSWLFKPRGRRLKFSPARADIEQDQPTFMTEQTVESVQSKCLMLLLGKGIGPHTPPLPMKAFLMFHNEAMINKLEEMSAGKPLEQSFEETNSNFGNEF